MSEEKSLVKRIRYVLAPPGMVFFWAGERELRSSILCDGAELSRAEYPDLFKSIGEKFGAGDGSTTFNVPNLPSQLPGVQCFIAADFEPRE